MNECLKCHSPKAKFFIGDDGHFRKECLECGYIGGPYVSRYIDKKMEDENEEKTKEGLFDY